MPDSELLPLDNFKWRTIRVASIAGGISLILLVLVNLATADRTLTCTAAQQAPTATVASTTACTWVEPSGFHLSPAWALALSTGLATVLAAAVVTLFFEFQLRRNFGSDLLRLLDLKTALVTSGLRDIGRSGQMDQHDEFARLDRLTYLGRTPNTWLNENLPALFRAAESRSIQITVALPDPNNHELMATVAQGLGTPPNDLGEAINAFVKNAQSQWRSVEPRVRAGTSLRIVYVSTAPLYDAIDSTAMVCLLVAKPLGHSSHDDHLILVHDPATSGFPQAWIAESLSGLDQENEVFMGGTK